MPGSGRCARCGGLIALATAAINVHPPRAGRVSRSMPRLWGRFWTLRQTLGNYSLMVSRPLAQLFARFEDTNFTLGTLLCCIVPGWAHRHHGNMYRASLFFFGYIAILIPGLIFFGTFLGSMLLGLAFGVHVASASDALVGRFATIGDRLSFTFACAAVIGLALYFPVGALAARVAVPVHINQDIQPFSRGDVLWYRPSTSITPGDFVLYTVPEATATGDHTRYIFGNQWINRVIAVSGQRVRLNGGRLFVDSRLSAWQPTEGMWASFDSEFVVPAGRVFIPPESLAPPGVRLTLDIWQQICVVPQSNVFGRIVFRSQPLWRISTINGIE